MKYIAMLSLIGTLVGAYFGPALFPPSKPIVIDGHTESGCGMWVIAAMFWGGVVGFASGAVLGGIFAYLRRATRHT